MGREEFFLEVADNKEAWERLKVVHLNFDDVEILYISDSHIIVEGRVCKRITTGIIDDLRLLAKVERWVKTGK